MKVRAFNTGHAEFWKAAKDAIENIEGAGNRLHTGAYSLILVATDGYPVNGEEDYVNCELSINSMGKNDPDSKKLTEILALTFCRNGRLKFFGLNTFMRYVENVDLDTLRDIQKRIENRLNMEASV